MRVYADWPEYSLFAHTKSSLRLRHSSSEHALVKADKLAAEYEQQSSRSAYTMTLYDQNFASLQSCLGKENESDQRGSLADHPVLASCSDHRFSSLQICGLFPSMGSVFKEFCLFYFGKKTRRGNNVKF